MYSGWVHKQCSDVVLLVKVEDTSVCRMWVREDDREDSSIVKSIDLGNGVQLENVGKFNHLGDMQNGRGVKSASVARVQCVLGKVQRFIRDLDEEGSAIKAESESVCDV